MQRLKLFILFLLYFITDSLCALHNVNRYIVPLLERPNPYKVRNFSNLTPTIFLGNAFGAYNGSNAHLGIPEVWGFYNLSSVTNSLSEQEGSAFINPFFQTVSIFNDLYGKPLIYRMSGKIKTTGLSLEYEQSLKYCGFSLGAFIPLMHITSNQNFKFDKMLSAPQARALSKEEIDQLDAIRRQVQKEMRLSAPSSNRVAFGDLDFYLRYTNEFEYVFLIKRIFFCAKTGILFPTGAKLEINNPASIPFGSNGHTCWYLDFQPELELRDDWKVGLMLGFALQNKTITVNRIPTTNEPFMYSAVTGRLYWKPGITWRSTVYIEIDNLFDGLNFQLRYTHLSHLRDSIQDRRSIVQRLQKPVNVDSLEDHTRWKADYITIQVTYDSKEAMHNWALEPTFFVSYDFPTEFFGAKGGIKNHLFNLGVEMHF